MQYKVNINLPFVYYVEAESAEQAGQEAENQALEELSNGIDNPEFTIEKIEIDKG